MTTIEAVVDRLYREYLSPADHQDTLCSFSAGVDSTSGTFQVDTSMMAAEEQGLLSPGTVIEAGLEQMLVTAYTSTSRVLTVLRGYAGTVSIPHAEGALIRVQPQFSRVTAFDAVSDLILELHPPLWRLGTATVMADNVPGEVPAGTVGVAAVTWARSDGAVVYGGGEVVRNWPSSATGRAVTLRGVPRGTEAVVTLKQEFTRPTAESDTLADLGISEGWVRILVLGAAAHLASYIDPSRLTFDWTIDADQAQNAPPGTASSLAARLLALRDVLITEAAAALEREYPTTVVRNAAFRPSTRQG